jgi:uncharacterized protein with FMN-binding domain
MLGASLVFSILAVVTLLPNPGASKPNVLGYRSVCSFAPAASAVCGLLAGITCTMRNRRVSVNASSARYQPFIAPAAAALALIAVVVGFGVRFQSIQSRYKSVIAGTRLEGQAMSGIADGTRSASYAEGDISATVELTANGGRIEDLRIKEGRNVEPGLAAVLFERVKTAQSSRVDAVSGATASSRVLLKAVEAAAAAAP